MLVLLFEGFGPQIHHFVVDQRPQRLHQVATEVEGVVHVIVKDAQLRQIACGGDFAIDGGENQPIAVIQRRVFRRVQRPGKFLAEQRVENWIG